MRDHYRYAGPDSVPFPRVIKMFVYISSMVIVFTSFDVLKLASPRIWKVIAIGVGRFRYNATN